MAARISSVPSVNGSDSALASPLQITARLADLDRASILSVDSSRQIDAVLGLADQLQDALRRVEAAAVTPVDATGGVILRGMGGSGVGGRLALAALGLRQPGR